MTAILRPIGLAAVLFALVAGYAGGAEAQNLTIPPPPTKDIVIYNNSGTYTIYPMIQVAINISNPDLWMQAQLVSFFPNKNPYPPFPMTLAYRAYINPTNGIPPNSSVEVKVPFYTQLRQVTDANIGAGNDQFIDWWNSERLYVFDSKTALDGAMISDGANIDGSQHSPTPISPLASAAVPSCVSASCTEIKFLSYRINPPANVPFQLQEYTFGSAEGPPLNPRPAKMMPEWVNYNISSLDSVYLPAAIGPLHNSSVPFVGSIRLIAKVQEALRTFASSGNNWPEFFPAYFADKKTNNPVNGVACSLSPFPGQTAYSAPVIPGTYNLLVGSYLNPPPIPPVLSSNPPKFDPNPPTCTPSPPPVFKTPNLGTAGQGIVDLWSKCTSSSSDTSTTCDEVRTVSNFFINNYQSACGQKPGTTAAIQAVYGWVPITYGGCTGGALATTSGYDNAIKTYCTLQYNYLDKSVPAAYKFNPYVEFIHQTLQSSAYAFSIDDKLSFKHVTGDGIIFAIGGAKGLENQTPTPLPTLDTYQAQCQTS